MTRPRREHTVEPPGPILVSGASGYIGGRLVSRLLAAPWFAGPVVIDRWFLHREVPALAG